MLIAYTLLYNIKIVFKGYQMAMTKRPAEAASDFIKKAPDAAAPAVSASTDDQKQISLKMTQELLDKVDAAAKALNISRAGFIKMCLSNAVKD